MRSDQNGSGCLCVLGKVIANRTVDYEEVHWLNFTVRASDNGSPPRAAEIPVYLEIVDINDNNPIFDQPSYQVGDQANRLGPGAVPIPWGLWASSAPTLPASKPHGSGQPMSSFMSWVLSISEFLGGGVDSRTDWGPLSLPARRAPGGRL